MTALALVAVVGLCGGLILAGSATGRWRVEPILSGSMVPYFHVGDAVLVTPVPRESIRRGDVIVFERPGDPAGSRPYVHRVAELGRDPDGTPLVRTKGDANNVEDPRQLRLEGAQVWRVSVVLPHAGTPLLVMRNLVETATPAVGLGLAGLVAGVALVLSGFRRSRPPAPERAAGGSAAPGPSPLARPFGL